MCLGSAASIVTLSYIVKFLGESDGRYGFLMASLSFGGVVDSMLVNAPFIQKRLHLFSRAGTLFMGLLLLSVLLKPDYNALLGILFVSGMVSSIIMTYYSIEIYKLYEPSEIRFQFSKFSIISNVAQGISRPIGAFGDKILGPIYSLASIGGLFVSLSLLLNGMHCAQNRERNTSGIG